MCSSGKAAGPLGRPLDTGRGSRDLQGGPLGKRRSSQGVLSLLVGERLVPDGPGGGVCVVGDPERPHWVFALVCLTFFGPSRLSVPQQWTLMFRPPSPVNAPLPKSNGDGAYFFLPGWGPILRGIHQSGCSKGGEGGGSTRAAIRRGAELQYYAGGVKAFWKPRNLAANRGRQRQRDRRGQAGQATDMLPSGRETPASLARRPPLTRRTKAARAPSAR